MKLFALFLLLHVSILALPSPSKANQSDNLHKFVMSRRTKNPSSELSWTQIDMWKEYSTSYVAPQEGLMQADKVAALPGQPNGVNFDQYAGYVTVDPKAGRALFYYFVESPQNSSTKPLILWFNGGPGCSSLGYGAMEELGPFRVNSDGKTLFRNQYAWTNVANVLFLESPAGVGFSYSNTSSENNRSGDRIAANDAYIFLINWLERFQQYKSKDLFITGESYAGHYAPQLAYTILLNNKFTNQTFINLKGIAIGNAWIDDPTHYKGLFDNLWTHALNSDETHEAINKYCDFYAANLSAECINSRDKALLEKGNIDIYNIYAPLCHDPSLKNGSTGSVDDYDPCSSTYVQAYLNKPEVQIALHANPTNWSICRTYNWTDWQRTVLPIIKNLTESGIRVWIYSGDTDGSVPPTSTRYSINILKLPIQVSWRPWYSGNEVGGYVVAYKGMTFVTVREAGHEVPSWQPERALTMITSFLNGTLPPSSPLF